MELFVIGGASRDLLCLLQCVRTDLKSALAGENMHVRPHLQCARILSAMDKT